MVTRIWRGWTEPSQADAYQNLLVSEIFPGIAARRIHGYLGIHLLRRDAGAEVEFVTIMWFNSWEDVRAFAGVDYEVRGGAAQGARAAIALRRSIGTLRHDCGALSSSWWPYPTNTLERLCSRLAEHVYVIGSEPAFEHAPLRAARVHEATGMARRAESERCHQSTEQRQPRKRRERQQHAGPDRRNTLGRSQHVARCVLRMDHLEPCRASRVLKLFRSGGSGVVHPSRKSCNQRRFVHFRVTQPEPVQDTNMRPGRKSETSPGTRRAFRNRRVHQALMAKIPSKCSCANAVLK